MSTSVVCQNLIKTPVPTFGVAGTYAQALYSASIKTKSKDQVAKDLVDFGNVLKSEKVSDYMNDPFIKSSTKLSKYRCLLKSRISIYHFHYNVHASNTKRKVYGRPRLIQNRFDKQNHPN